MKTINLCLSNRCFVNCPGCYNRFSKDPNEIDSKIIFEFLSYARSYGLEKITLSGGDPLVRRDIESIVSFCNSIGLKVNMDTVGTSIIKSCETKKGVKTLVEKIIDFSFLKDLQYLGIPLDGSNSKIISTFRRGRPNIFEEQLEIIDFLNNFCDNICINTVYHKHNYEDIANIFKIISQFRGVKKWQVFEYMGIGDQANRYSNYFATGDDLFQKSIKDIYPLIQKNSNIIVDFKSSKSREQKYLFSNSAGEVYKTNLKNQTFSFGNITRKETWAKIVANL